MATQASVAAAAVAAAGTGTGAESLRVRLHGTPRQWGDARRPWVLEEKDRCVATLKHAGVDVEERVYFKGELPSLGPA